MINHRGGILIFLSKFEFWKNRKFEILNPSSNPNFEILNPKPKFSILANFGYLLNLVLPNLDRSRRQLSNDTKIVKFGQNLVQKFLISQILWVLGCCFCRNPMPNLPISNFLEKNIINSIYFKMFKIQDKNPNFTNLPKDFLISKFCRSSVAFACILCQAKRPIDFFSRRRRKNDYRVWTIIAPQSLMFLISDFCQSREFSVDV